ncbi:MAG: nucleoside hydrolase [Anaerolineae bacterium]|nr:nucleoside hydrolase [Anaerolineae bacterium]
MTRQFLIDTDVGSDDAVALIMAFRAADVDVLGITTVSGNVPARQAAINALVVVELCDVDIPVYVGAEAPLLRPYADAAFFHGTDGLGDQNYPAPNGQIKPKHAVDVIIDSARQNPGLVLVTLGPLTNIALAVHKAPDIIPNIARCVVMGGSACTYGNVTPAAEYNIWVDPDAARMVFLSGLAVEMVGWEFCQGDFSISMDEIDTIRSFDNPLAHFAIDCNLVAIKAFERQTGQKAMSLPDPVAMAVALDPTIATQTSKHFVEVEVHSDLTRGMTLVDKLNVATDGRNTETWAQAVKAGKNVSVTWDVDSKRWKQLLYDALQ